MDQWIQKALLQKGGAKRDSREEVIYLEWQLEKKLKITGLEIAEWVRISTESVEEKNGLIAKTVLCD